MPKKHSRKRPFAYKPRPQPCTWRSEEARRSEEELQRRRWMTRFERDEIEHHQYANA